MPEDKIDMVVRDLAKRYYSHVEECSAILSSAHLTDLEKCNFLKMSPKQLYKGLGPTCVGRKAQQDLTRDIIRQNLACNIMRHGAERLELSTTRTGVSKGPGGQFSFDCVFELGGTLINLELQTSEYSTGHKQQQRPAHLISLENTTYDKARYYKIIAGKPKIGWWTKKQAHAALKKWNFDSPPNELEV